MIICVCGSRKSGKNTLINYLQSVGYELFEYTETICETIMDDKLWNKKIVIKLKDIQQWIQFKKRPFAALVVIISPSSTTWRNENDDEFLKKFFTMRIDKEIVDCKEILNFGSIQDLFDIFDKKLIEIRPQFDNYFMSVAFTVSKRSNCMKSKIGAIIVKDKRIIAAGYSGTPTGILNCFEGGCIRCNSNAKNNTNLTYCVCLHAEESALLNIGYERCRGSSIYCTHFPCQLCFRKIVQMGVKQVYYSIRYSQNDDYIIKCFKESDIETIHLPISSIFP